MAPAARSLMDNGEFLEELEHVEPVVTVDESAHERERTLDGLDEGLPLTRFEYPREASVRRAPAKPTREPTWVGVPSPQANERSTDGTGWLLAGFLTLTIAGAAGAALLFHARVADIVALLR